MKFFVGLVTFFLIALPFQLSWSAFIRSDTLGGLRREAVKENAAHYETKDGEPVFTWGKKYD